VDEYKDREGIELLQFKVFAQLNEPDDDITVTGNKMFRKLYQRLR
jgi:hypothetical protein